MKKVIGIFLIMVFMFVMVSMAEAADIAYGHTCYEAEELVKDWAIAQGYYDYIKEDAIDEVAYGIGGIDVNDFKKDSGLEWSIENFNEYSINYWDMCEIHTKCVGQAEGYNVYLTEAQSETTALATIKGEKYYCVKALFMVYSENDINGNPTRLTEDVITETTTWENVETQTWD